MSGLTLQLSWFPNEPHGFVIISLVIVCEPFLFLKILLFQQVVIKYYDEVLFFFFQSVRVV